MMFVGGLLAQRFGGKRVMLIGLASSSVLTILTPVAARFGDFPGILVDRILMGLAQVEKFQTMFHIAIVCCSQLVALYLSIYLVHEQQNSLRTRTSCFYQLPCTGPPTAPCHQSPS